jgi:Tol biopolymer transport system component
MLQTAKMAIAALAALIAGSTAPPAKTGPAGTTAPKPLVRTVRVAPPGIDPNGPSGDPSFGGSRYLAFASQATNLGPAVGPKRVSNVYVYDIFTGAVSLISHGLASAPADGPSSTPSVSADGQVVAFASKASNLVAGLPSRYSQIFVRDRTAAIRLVSVGFGGGPANADSTQPALSSDGHYLAFASSADNLVPGDDNASSDIFEVDLLTGAIHRVSVTSQGGQARGNSYNPSISADGRLVSFTSDAGNLVPHDRNRAADVFVHDLATGVTRRVSVSSKGKEQNQAVPSPFEQFSDLSGDGHHIVFDSNATNLTPGAGSGQTSVFSHDLDTGQTTLLSRSTSGQSSDNDTFAPATDFNGGTTVFESFADNLADPWVPSENVYVRDGATSSTLNVDVAPDGGPRAAEVDQQLLQQAAISPTGQLIAFASGAYNLVSGDYNGIDDLFLRIITAPKTYVISAPAQTADRRPQIEIGGSTPLARLGLCSLDGRPLGCPIGRRFRLPKVKPGRHVFTARCAEPGTLFDPVGVTIKFFVTKSSFTEPVT